MTSRQKTGTVQVVGSNPNGFSGSQASSQQTLPSVIMAKLLVALMILTLAYVIDARCKSDSCKGRSPGKRYKCECLSENYFFTCGNEGELLYDSCPWDEFFGEFGFCGWGTDTCAGKRNGRYQSFRRKRPFFYSCQYGQLYYEQCQRWQIFNGGTKRCDCFDGVCLHGDGWKESFCYGKGWRVYCDDGYPRRYEECPKSKPHCCKSDAGRCCR